MAIPCSNSLRLFFFFFFFLGKMLAPVSGFEEVADSENRTVLKQQTRTPTQVLSAQEAYLLTDMLGAGTKYGSIRELDLGFPAALTASSSQDGKAQWAVGYTPQLLAGVMLLTSETDQERRLPPLYGTVAGVYGRRCSYLGAEGS